MKSQLKMTIFVMLQLTVLFWLLSTRDFGHRQRILCVRQLYFLKMRLLKVTWKTNDVQMVMTNNDQCGTWKLENIIFRHQFTNNHANAISGQ